MITLSQLLGALANSSLFFYVAHNTLVYVVDNYTKETAEDEFF